MNEDEISKQIVAVFEQAKELARQRGVARNTTMDMPAMDLLLDHALDLGPDGLFDIVTMLAVHDGEPITRTQMAVALNRYHCSRESKL
jgi:hypothetical protein